MCCRCELIGFFIFRVIVVVFWVVVFGWECFEVWIFEKVFIEYVDLMYLIEFQIGGLVVNRFEVWILFVFDVVFFLCWYLYKFVYILCIFYWWWWVDIYVNKYILFLQVFRLLYCLLRMDICFRFQYLGYLSYERFLIFLQI